MCRWLVTRIMASMPASARMARLNWAFCKVFALRRSNHRGVMSKYTANAWAISSASGNWASALRPPAARMARAPDLLV